ncbi:hypothetical protein Back11_18060 [Paenibacillus baekrokdamisoli]|uniref:Uncharacterized protein n=1 Tax=Paenibacillus baekrokdamisoli TaxID=1712516 RepID=A0A3G9J3T7_9BACL|nr:hypothetical protein [Paenibacillus baekrokdamisoli]MBB3072400.1 oligoendopeptidase F [Paenibacillus baekrokdamisoli]BBH20461.1 hypothetical protein Back11_18060 [Paenibacillus baekrokdamisoli]
MLDSNKQITFSGSELIEVLKEIEVILQSLHRMGSYYGVKFQENGEDKFRAEYEKETTRFIDEWGITQKIANIRKILSDKFDRTLDADDMDDLERAMEGLKFWTKPADELETE